MNGQSKIKSSCYFSPFTRESIGGPPSTPSLDRPLHNRKSIPCQPIFSPAIRLEAKKRSMPVSKC